MMLTGGERWTLAARRAGTHALIVWPPLAIAFMVVVSVQKGALTQDLVHAYLPAAHKVLHGASPYPPPVSDALLPRTAFIYPPVTAWLVAPLAALPLPAAEAVGLLAMIAAVITLLLLLDVRDWRCHMIALLWLPTYSALQIANIALPIAVGIAALWRYRNRPLAAGLLTGALVALKLYLWPLGLWLLLTRRFRQSAVAAATAILLVLASWAPIGFAGARQYPHLLRLVTKLEAPDGYTLAALAAPATGWRIAELVAAPVAIAVLAYAWRFVRRGDEQGAFICVIASTLLLTPIVSMCYLVVLLVPIGLRAPRLRPLWALPLALWVGPQVSNGRPWQTAAVLCICAAVVTITARSPHLPLRLGHPRRMAVVPRRIAETMQAWTS